MDSSFLALMHEQSTPEAHMRVKCWCSIQEEFKKIHFDQPECFNLADEEYHKMI